MTPVPFLLSIPAALLGVYPSFFAESNTASRKGNETESGLLNTLETVALLTFASFATWSRVICMWASQRIDK